jgi:hypothetical protein
MKQNERFFLAVNLIVHVEAVHGSVAALSVLVRDV